MVDMKIQGQNRKIEKNYFVRGTLKILAAQVASHNESFWSARVHVRHSDKTEVYVIFKTNTTKAAPAAGQNGNMVSRLSSFQIWKLTKKLTIIKALEFARERDHVEN